jgi:hypothetical protein
VAMRDQAGNHPAMTIWEVARHGVLTDR